MDLCHVGTVFFTAENDDFVFVFRDFVLHPQPVLQQQIADLFDLVGFARIMLGLNVEDTVFPVTYSVPASNSEMTLDIHTLKLNRKHAIRSSPCSRFQIKGPRLWVEREFEKEDIRRHAQPSRGVSSGVVCDVLACRRVRAEFLLRASS